MIPASGCWLKDLAAACPTSSALAQAASSRLSRASACRPGSRPVSGSRRTYHLRLADLHAHRDQLTTRRIILTHLSADMLDGGREASFEFAHDGLTVGL